jgi:hypothetical protein
MTGARQLDVNSEWPIFGIDTGPEVSSRAPVVAPLDQILKRSGYRSNEGPSCIRVPAGPAARPSW